MPRLDWRWTTVTDELHVATGSLQAETKCDSGPTRSGTQSTQNHFIYGDLDFFFGLVGGAVEKRALQINTLPETQRKNGRCVRLPLNHLLCSKVHCGTVPVDAGPPPDGSRGSYYTAFLAPPPPHPSHVQLLSLAPPPALPLYARRQFPERLQSGRDARCRF